MQAVILVGGEGRRLRPLTDTRPKPMLPLVDRPFVAHQLDQLRRHGITDVVFSCGYRPDALEAHFGDGSAMGMRVRYVVDPEPLGTAGAIKNAQGLLDGEAVFVLNGDILTDLDLGAMIARHRETGAVGTLALTPVEDPSAFGLVRLHDDFSVEAFVEKPSRDELRPGEPFRINAGTYLLEPSAVDSIPAGRACSIEREVFPQLAAGGRLFGFPSTAYWRDIGTPASYLAAHHDVLSGAVVTESPSGAAYLGPGARIGSGASVDPLSSLGAGADVGPSATVEGSVVGEEALIGDGAALIDAILGAGVRVGAGARIGEGAVVGDGASIAAGFRVDGSEPIPTGASVG
jgi:mannose-1-phosphate guanylyltransferase